MCALRDDLRSTSKRYYVSTSISACRYVVPYDHPILFFEKVSFEESKKNAEMSSLQAMLVEQRAAERHSATIFETVSQQRDRILTRWRGFWVFESPVDSPLMRDGQALHHGPVASGPRPNCELYVDLDEETPAEYLSNQTSVLQAKNAAGIRLPPAMRLTAIWTQGTSQFVIRGKLNQSLASAEDCAVHRRVRIPMGSVAPEHKLVSWEGACTPAQTLDNNGYWKTVTVNASAVTMAYDEVSEFVSPCCLQLAMRSEAADASKADDTPDTTSTAVRDELIIRFDRFVAKASPSGKCVARRNPFPRLWVISQDESDISCGEEPLCSRELPRTWSVCSSQLNSSTIQIVLAAQRRAVRKKSTQIWLPTFYASRCEGVSDDCLPKYPNIKVISTDEFDNSVLNGDFAVFWYNPKTSLSLGVKTRELLETSLGTAACPSRGVVVLPLPGRVIDLLKARRINFFHIDAQLPTQGDYATQHEPSSELSRAGCSFIVTAALDEIGQEKVCEAGWSHVCASFSSVEMAGAVICQHAVYKML